MYVFLHVLHDFTCLTCYVRSFLLYFIVEYVLHVAFQVIFLFVKFSGSPYISTKYSKRI